MNGDVRHFKRRFFGGFDTVDVMRYIEELAAQRNKYKSSGDRLEKELTELGMEIKRLQSELDDADRRIMDIKVKALDDAACNVTSFQESYSSMRTEVETTAFAISSELGKLNAALTYIATVLDKTGQRFGELETALEKEKSEAVAAFNARLRN